MGGTPHTFLVFKNRLSYAYSLKIALRRAENVQVKAKQGQIECFYLH